MVSKDDTFQLNLIKTCCPFVRKIRYRKHDDTYVIHLYNGYLKEESREPHLAVSASTGDICKAILTAFKTDVVDYYRTHQSTKTEIAERDYEEARELNQ